MIYDDEQIGADFSHLGIFDGETLQIEVHRAPEQYWFRGYSESRYYFVAITVDQ